MSDSVLDTDRLGGVLLGLVGVYLLVLSVSGLYLCAEIVVEALFGRRRN